MSDPVSLPYASNNIFSPLPDSSLVGTTRRRRQQAKNLFPPLDHAHFRAVATVTAIGGRRVGGGRLIGRRRR